jgi:hypothetical protein
VAERGTSRSRTRNLNSGLIFFRILACSTASEAFPEFIFRTTAAEVMVWTHHRSELLKIAGAASTCLHT